MITFKQIFSKGEPAQNTQDSGFIYKVSLYSVMFFIFLIPWGNGLFDGFVKVVGILSFGLASLYLITQGVKKNFTYFHFFVITLWSWIILSVAWTTNIQEGLAMAPRIFQIMLLPFLFTIIISAKNSVLLAYKSYVFGTIVAASIIIYNFINGIESPYYGRYTIANTETDSMSIILALAVPIAAYLASVSTIFLMKAAYTISIPMIIFAIFLTGTRTGSIVAIIGVLYLLFTHRSASFKVKMAIAVVFIISIVSVLSFAPKASVDRVFSAGKSLQSGDLNYRTVVWGASLEQWKRSPVIGTGLGGLGDVLSREHVNYNAAHNTHIHILVENGIIGLFIYLLLELSILLVILQTPYPDKVFLLTLFSAVVLSQLTLHTHIFKETWFALTMIVIHATLVSKRHLLLNN